MSFLDNATAVVFIMVFAIVVLIAAFVMNAWVSNPTVASWGGTSTTVTTNATNAISAFDGLIVIIMVGVIIASVISALFINTHPVYFIILFLVEAFMILFSRVIGDVYLEFAANPTMAATSAGFPLTTLLFTYLPYFTLVSLTISGIALYSKRVVNRG